MELHDCSLWTRKGNIKGGNVGVFLGGGLCLSGVGGGLLGAGGPSINGHGCEWGVCALYSVML